MTIAATVVALTGATIFASLAVSRTDVRVDRSFADHGVFHAAVGTKTVGCPDGRLVSVRPGEEGLVVRRFLSGGRPDRTFGEGDGVATISRPSPRLTPGYWTVTAVAVDPDGGIVVAGYTIAGRGETTELGPVLHDSAVARLRRDGSLVWLTDEETGEPPADARSLPLPLRGSTIEAIAFQGRKILLGANIAEFTFADRGLVARLNADGSADRTFAKGDSLTYIPPEAPHVERLSEVSTLLAAPGGEIYAAGSLRSRLVVARLTKRGLLDHRFSGDGLLRDPSRGPRGFSSGRGLARDGEGRLLVSGDGRSGFLALARFRSDGNRDRSFGRDGVVRTRVADYSSGRGLSIQPDGRIVVAAAITERGSLATGGDRVTLGLMRFRPDGRLDPTFFGTGIFDWPGERWLDTGADWRPSIGPKGAILLAGGNAAMRFRSAR
jgi:uncharacterized delta-60 repeat protein